MAKNYLVFVHHLSPLKFPCLDFLGDGNGPSHHYLSLELWQ